MLGNEEGKALGNEEGKALGNEEGKALENEEGKALGNEEGTAMRSGYFCVQKEKSNRDVTLFYRNINIVTCISD
jgi:hypothetical protein